MKTRNSIMLSVLVIAIYAVPSQTVLAQDVQPPQVYFKFNGSPEGSPREYVQISDSSDFSIPTTRGLTVSVWMRPDTLSFPRTEGSQPCERFAHWLGKGEGEEQEWAFRMYSLNPDCEVNPRENRISFYIFPFGPPPIRGCGVAFQDQIEAGQWIHVVGVADDANKEIRIYKNGSRRTTFSYVDEFEPMDGSAPLRMGTRDFRSFFQGAIAEVRIWNRPLDDTEVRVLSESRILPEELSAGLVGEFLLNDSRLVSGRSVEGNVFGKWESDSNPVINTTTGTNHRGC